jgi:predicted aspartyl protease
MKVGLLLMNYLYGWSHRCFLRAALMGAVAFLGLAFVLGAPRHTHAAVAAGEVSVHAEADASSPLIETVRDGAALLPMMEMTGAGGEKWFMVKTPAGNVGWIKANDQSAAKRIDDHFRAMPRDAGSIAPVSNLPETESKVSAGGVVRVRVRVQRNQVVVPVTFTNGFTNVTGNLVMDTGATQTVISKRLARELRLLSTGFGYGVGVGGAVPAEAAMVDSMKVGTIGVKNVRVSILDFATDGFYEGLLGFDFLQHFQLSVDREKQLLVLTPQKQ